ncbi:toll/interleukin-1 receptor domain-containing protein [Planomonospora venezuelensis]|uniref:toll/interleukin-1 receptor domain-containing protein n=1 Tax=Planomonospora venezuelensis TaxID=1999 RepID=UPI00361FF270
MWTSRSWRSPWSAPSRASSRPSSPGSRCAAGPPGAAPRKPPRRAGHPPGGRWPRVVSCTDADLEWVRRLADRLREAELRVTYEEVLRSPGAVVVETIERAIQEARHGVLVFIGMIAENRGDYDRALEWYRKALDIDEELGDRANLATGYGQLGALYAETGQAAEAVPYLLLSLVVHAELQVPETDVNLYWLGRQREALGEQEFRRVLAEHLAPGDAAVVLGWLDQRGERASEEDPP